MSRPNESDLRNLHDLLQLTKRLHARADVLIQKLEEMIKTGARLRVDKANELAIKKKRKA